MTNDPVPAVAARVLELFHGPLSDVRFPDVDRASLDADAAAVREASEAVRDAEAALSAAKDALEAAQRVLRERAQRGLSYARIFAETRPDLANAIGGSGAVASAASEAAPTRRRRARRPASEVTELLPDLAAE